MPTIAPSPIPRFLLVLLALLPVLALAPAQAQQPAPAPERPLVFVPGLLGSLLCRPGPDGEPIVVWGTLDALGQFPTLAIGPAGTDLEPCGLLREVSFLGIFTQGVYGPFVDRLAAAGYREGETLFVFDYDWRLSVFDNAARLAAFVEAEIPGGGPVDIVAHSMGGLVARTYVAEHGGGARVARLLSAGTPWRGSVQVFQLLEGGWGLANNFMGGLEAFRRTVIGFPSTLELLPDYDGCCGGAPDAARFDPARPAAWTALNWAGIEPAALPDLAAAAVRQQRLRRIVAASLPEGVEEALVIGVDQRTPEHYELRIGDGEARLTIGTSWEGDGTVIRDSALLPRRVTYPTSFATHDAILNDALVQDFVLAALAEGPEAARAKVPVRERSSILTALGELVELVGVAVVTDRPLYRTGEVARLTVHLRLETTDPVDAAAIAVQVVPPGGPAVPVPLAPAPAASDPANPLEQSFSGRFATGAVAGELALTVTLASPGAEPRVVTRVLPVLAP